MTSPAKSSGVTPLAEAKAKKAPAKKAPAKKEPAKKPAPSKADGGAVVKKLRSKRMRSLAMRLGLFVVLPTLLAAIYFGAVATDQFESYSEFTVHSVEGGGVGFEGLLGGLAPGASRDTLIVRDHIESRDMLAKLNQDAGFSEAWQDPRIDPLARLAADASFEDAFEHYQEQVLVEYDSNSGVLTLRVRAPSRELAQEFAKTVLDYSEKRVNELSRRERDDRTRYAEEQVAKTEARLAKARTVLLEQQQAHDRLNPRQEAGASMTIRTDLEGELARARAKLSELSSFMKKDAPKVKKARERVKALSAQVGAQKRKLVNPEGKGGLAEDLVKFEEAMVEKEFAEAAYTTALATLELARADASRQHRYLAVIAPPSTPDDSTYPERGLGVLTVLVMSFLALGIGSLLIASVREHARV